MPLLTTGWDSGNVTVEISDNRHMIWRDLFTRVADTPMGKWIRPCSYMTYRAALHAHCAVTNWREQSMPLPDGLAARPPAMLRFRVSETVDLDTFVRVGQSTVDDLAAVLGAEGDSMQHFTSVLDFGCGCGRTLLWLMPRLAHARVHGTDTDREAIAWCRRNIPAALLGTNSPTPPLPYRSAEFDLIYSISVFTHLSEPDQFAWLSELSRILMPGGALVATVHGAQAREILSPPEHAALVDQGFLFRTSRKLKGILPDWYHTAFHTTTYIHRTWSAYFKTVRVLPGAMGAQDAVVARN